MDARRVLASRLASDLDETHLPLLRPMGTGAWRQERGRLIILLAGPSGAGKSVLAGLWEQLASQGRIDVSLQSLPMDGFHYPKQRRCGSTTRRPNFGLYTEAACELTLRRPRHPNPRSTPAGCLACRLVTARAAGGRGTPRRGIPQRHSKSFPPRCSHRGSQAGLTAQGTSRLSWLAIRDWP